MSPAAALLLAALGAAAADDCPEGAERVATNQPLRPYHCVAKDSVRKEGPFMSIRPAFRGLSGCPQGFRPLKSSGPLSYRCVRDSAGPLDKTLQAPSDPPSQGEPEAPSGFERMSARGVRLDVPRGWARTDGWQDEVPMIYLESGQRRRGKPVAMTVTRVSPGQPGYESMDAAISKEKEYQHARETAPGKVGGLRARQTIVAGESRTAYADAGAGAYYVLSYSAPAELFAAFEPSYERLLSSARFGAR